MYFERIRECKRTKEDFDVLRTRMISKNEQSLENPLLQPHIFWQIKMFKVSIYRCVNCQKKKIVQMRHTIISLEMLMKK